jgi:hypothetical protein
MANKTKIPDRLVTVIITSRLLNPLVVTLPESDLDWFVLAMTKNSNSRMMYSQGVLADKYPVGTRRERK